MLIGLEMYPAGEQAMLDKWSTDPAYTEADFLAQSRWYKNWGYHWEYYRPIFDFAHRHGLRMFGLNVPRKVVQTARKEGLAALTPEQRELLPATIDTDSAEYRRLFQAFFSNDGLHGGMSAEMFEGMFTAQCTWDAAMAHNALKALARFREETGQRTISARRASLSRAARRRSSRCGSRIRRPTSRSPRRAPRLPASSGASRRSRIRSIPCSVSRRRNAIPASR